MIEQTAIPQRSAAIPRGVRPPVSAIQQWWVLTIRMIIPTLRNGELGTQIVGSIVFTIGYYLPLKQMMGAVQPLSSYAQYLTPLIILQAIWFAAISAAFRSATDSVQGINRRFRAMPIPSITPLASRMTASMYRCCIALVVSVSVLVTRTDTDNLATPETTTSAPPPVQDEITTTTTTTTTTTENPPLPEAPAGPDRKSVV